MQILVVVANTHVRTVRAEAEKGSRRTVIDPGLVDPKPSGNSVTKLACRLLVIGSLGRKGSWLRFQHAGVVTETATLPMPIPVVLVPCGVIFSV